jgi:hypothetical protein
MLKPAIIIFLVVGFFYILRKIVFHRIPDSKSSQVISWHDYIEAYVSRNLRQCLASKNWLIFEKKRLFQPESPNYQTIFYINKVNTNVVVATMAIYWNSIRPEKLAIQIGNVHIESKLDENNLYFFFVQVNRLLRQTRFARTA